MDLGTLALNNGVDGGDQFTGGFEAIGGVLFKALEAEGVNFCGHTLIDLRRRNNGVPDELDDRLHGGASLEGRVACEQPIEGRTEAVDIARRGHGSKGAARLGLLGRHEVHGSHNGARSRELNIGSFVFNKTEVH